MRQDKFSKTHLTLYACGIIPVVWLALLLAPYVGGGLLGLVQYGGAALNDPFHIVLCTPVLYLLLLTPRTKRVRVPLGQTPCSRTSANSVWVWNSPTRRCAHAS